MLTRVGRFLHMWTLHLTQSKAHSLYKPNSAKSFFTHSSLPLPLCLTPSTSKLLHAETQSSLSFRCAWQNQCNLLRLTTSVMQRSWLLNFALAIVLTPHVHLHHYLFSSLQSCHILHFHSPSFIRKFQNNLTTSPMYLSFHFVRSTVVP